MITFFNGSRMKLEIPPVPERLLNPHICDMGYVRSQLVGPFPVSTPPSKVGVYVTSETPDPMALGRYGMWRKYSRKGWKWGETTAFWAGREKDPVSHNMTDHYWWGFTEDFYQTLKEYHENHI